MWGLGNDLSNAAPYRADRDSETGVSHGMCRGAVRSCEARLRPHAGKCPSLLANLGRGAKDPVTPPAKGALGFVTDAAPGNRSSEDLRTAGGRQAL